MLSLSSEHTASSSHEPAALPAHASPSSTGLPNDESQHPGSPIVQEPKGSWLRILVLVLLVGSAIAFVVYRIRTNHSQAAGAGPGGRRSASANALTPVSYDVVTKRTIPISLTALGTVTAYNTVTLRSRVDGQIVKVNFQEGQRVRQGQSLIQIDPAPYLATLAVAKGNLVRDQANAALAQVQSQRYNQLYAAGVVSKESTQTQESTAGQAVGTVAADRAAIQQAQVNVNYTNITSPINGVVGLRQVDMGNVVSAASTTGLVVLTQVQPIAVIFTLPEDQLPAVFAHMRSNKRLLAEAWDRANTTKLSTGALLTVDNQIDTTTGTAKLKAVFTNEDNALYPNQFVNIHLVLENRANSLVIPAAAIQTGNSGSFVFVIDRSQGQSVPTNTGASNDSSKRGQASTVTPGGTAPAGGAGGGNTAAASTGGGTVGNGPGGGPITSGSAPAGGRRGGPQMSYPVRVVPVVIDSTQGTDVILKSGLAAGQQVVTDGQEKLQDKSRVVPRPSSDLAASRQGANNFAPEAATNGNAASPAAGAFNNGLGSDRDVPGGAKSGTKGSPRGGGDASTSNTNNATGKEGAHHRRSGAPPQ